jgi:PAS domain S-box-containing protein
VSRPDPWLVLETLLDAVVVADRTGRITYVNHAAERLLGWPAEELVGRPIAAIIPPGLRNKHIAGFNRYRSTWNPRILGRGIRVPAQRRDGTEVRIELGLTAFRGRGGEELYVAVLRDLSERAETKPLPSQTGAFSRLHAIGASLSECTDLRRLVKQAGDALSAHFGAIQPQFWLHHPARNTLELLPRSPTPEGFAEPLCSPIDLAASESIVARVGRSREPYLARDLSDAPEFDAGWARGNALLAAGVFPLLYAGELLGVATYFSREPPTEEALQALSLFLVLVAAALHETRHREALALQDRHAARVKAFAEITVAIVRGEPLPVILEQIVQRGLELLRADEGAVLLPTPLPGEYQVCACAGYKTPITGLSVPPGLGITGQVIAQNETVVIEDYQRFPQALPRIRQRGVWAAIGAPLRREGAVVGVLKLESKKAGRTFTDDDRSVVQALADQAALALLCAS